MSVSGVISTCIESNEDLRELAAVARDGQLLLAAGTVAPRQNEDGAPARAPDSAFEMDYAEGVPVKANRVGKRPTAGKKARLTCGPDDSHGLGPDSAVPALRL